MSGIRVLEFGHYIAGPFCTQILADQGADVIKVEPPGGGPRRNSDPVKNKGGYFPMLNRNKRSIEVDLKSGSGRDVLAALVRSSDVLVTNYANGVPEKLGFGYQALREINPRLVYVHITGFGDDSPYARKPAYDGIIQAMTGLMHMTGEPGRPPALAGVFVPDHVTGLHATLAVMFGLRRLEVTGTGTFTDLAMFDSMLTFLGALPSDVREFGEHPRRNGGTVPRSYAGVHPASDGWVYLAPMAPRMWEGVAEVIGDPTLLEYYSNQPGAADRRMAHRADLDARIDAWTAKHTVAEVEQAMGAAGVACNAIFDIEAIVADPNVAHRKLLRTVTMPGGHERTVVASPFPVDEATYAAAPPLAGQHNAELLAELGLSADGDAGHGGEA
jgi:crotonobetainyl-CoA:carnitine CoA-transferase CaiB-like acyl-CoA transferase